MRQHSLSAKPGRRKPSDIMLMKEDPAGVEAQSEEIKPCYAKGCERMRQPKTPSSFRDACQARRPGSHNYDLGLWIPGSPLRAAPE